MPKLFPLKSFYVFTFFCSFLTSDPAAAKANTDSAKSLAQKMVAHAGDPTQLSALQFTFSVHQNGKEAVRRTHLWCPKTQKLQVTSDKKSPILNLASTADKNTKSYAQFINDSYWLFAPSKALDSGVNLALEGKLLKLTFGQVGLTPKDQYLLKIDPSSGALLEWSFTLQNGKKGSYKWLNPQKVGPLHLKLLRKNAAGREIRFSEVKILASCPL